MRKLTIRSPHCMTKPALLGIGTMSFGLLIGCTSEQGALFDDLGNEDIVFTAEQEQSDAPSTVASGASSDNAEAETGTSPDDSAASDSQENSASDSLTLDGQMSDANNSDGNVQPSESEGQENIPEDVLVLEEPVAGPIVVSVVPENNAIGINADTSIVITFNVGMNRERTQAAYQSEGIPSSSVEFTWNDASTQLTIIPVQPLQYNSGSDPELVEARRLSFFLSASAEDAEGNSMAAAAESSFSMLREIRGSLLAVQDRDLSGSYRSNDTYGGGQCSRSDETICVGDSGTGDEVSYRGFITFELGAMPVGLNGLASARLDFEIDDLEGQPFRLGALQIDHTQFDEIGLEAFNQEALARVALIEDPEDEGDSFSIDVLEAFSADLLQRDRAQFRLSFEIVNDEEEDFDAVVTSWDTHTLNYSFLIP